MILTPAAYNRLYSLHLNEYNLKILEEKTQAMAVYVTQADEILDFIESENSLTFSDKKRLQSFFGELDRQMDFYNSDFTREFGISLNDMGLLAYDQLFDFTDLAGITVDQSIVRLQDTFLRDLLIPSEVPEFNLSSAIWADSKRVDIFQVVIQASNSGLSPSQITQTLSSYLKESNKGVGNHYYKAERVVETELQRAYTRAGIDSTREYNREYDTGLVIKRSLSPAHKVVDICDVLVGYYDPDGYVPTAVHPFDMCLNQRVFREDSGSEVIRNIKKRTFIDTETGQSAKLY